MFIFVFGIIVVVCVFFIVVVVGGFFGVVFVVYVCVFVGVGIFVIVRGIVF